MDAHIDWLSFSIANEEDVTNLRDLYNRAKRLLREVSNEHERYIYDGTGFEHAVSRPPFRYALARDDGGVRLFGGGTLALVLYELTGRACEGLRSYDAACAFLAPFVGCLSRMDIAVDILCPTLPSVFCNQRNHKSFRTVSFIRSSTGETVYIGSPKSDRFARVYRYNSPHPRAALLRCEFVFRRGLAKSAADALLSQGSYEAFIASAGNTWGWAHPDWQPAVKTNEKVLAPILRGGDEDTVMWLHKQVAPAMARLLKAEALDLAEFLEYVYSLQ